MIHKYKINTINLYLIYMLIKKLFQNNKYVENRHGKINIVIHKP